MSPAPHELDEGVGLRPLVACWPLGLTPTSPQVQSYTMGRHPEHGLGPRDSSCLYQFLLSGLPPPSTGQSLSSVSSLA